MTKREASALFPRAVGDLMLVKCAVHLLTAVKPVVREWVIRALQVAKTCINGFRGNERPVTARRQPKGFAYRPPAIQVAEQISPRDNPLAAFLENGSYGLRTPDEQILAPEYDAVWPMLSGKFWGFRSGVVFGVVAADGTEVISCSLPARYQGYRELSAEDERRALQVSETRFLSYLREQYLGLHITGSKLCQPAAWMVEELTPHLECAHNVLSFKTYEFTLLLWDSGKWAWRQPSSIPRVKDIICATSEPVTYSETSPLLFTEPSTNDLLNWRLRYRRPGGITEEEEARWDQEIDEKVAVEYDQLVDVPTSIGDSWDRSESPYYLFFTPDFFPPHVVPACLQHLQAFPAIHQHEHKYVERLIYLAWLWANGYVRKTYLPPYYVVDARYIIDSEWFDNVPIQDVYLHYQLQALAPLLAEMTREE